MHELLRQRAVALDLLAPDAELDDSALDTLLEREMRVPEPTREDCERYYTQHAKRFGRNELVYASHILFAITDRVPLARLRQKAEETLRDLQQAPDTFEALTRQFSNCPSAGVGGSLGQLTRGDTVPEFEAALFDCADIGVLPRLVRTRFGFHLVRVDQRMPGNPVPYDEVSGEIALSQRTRTP
ncbi:peptidylprolyl isomerase [Paraburkholderia sp. CNPSo 3076]|nr:peptidylprolyl isomerase [Paraburkholderia sp. CNPSo 3076]